MEWPFAAPGLDQQAGLYWVPGMSFDDTLATYWRYYLTTSLVYDLFRAVANVVLVVALGRPILRMLARYRERFTWSTWVPLEPDARGGRMEPGTARPGADY
jgi:energy-coupling factor transport system substrate-specific component